MLPRFGWYDPGEHWRHADAAAPEAYVPTGHLTHLSGDGAYLPGSQLVQLVAAGGENEPSGHDWHAVWATAAAYVPAGHGAHWFEVSKAPRGHGVITVPPHNAPGGHARQMLLLLWLMFK